MAIICLAELGVNPWSKFLLFYLFQHFGMCVGYGFLCSAVIRSLVGPGDGGKTDTPSFKNDRYGFLWLGEDIQWRPVFENTVLHSKILCWELHLMWGPQNVKRTV